MIGKINDRQLYELGLGDRFTYIVYKLHLGDTGYSQVHISEEVAKALLAAVGRTRLDNKEYTCVRVVEHAVRGRRMIVNNHDGQYSVFWAWKKGDE